MTLSEFCKSLARKKPMEITGSKLNKFMGTFDLTAIGVGSTLGLGVYVLTGDVSKNQAGPAVILSFAIAAVASVFAGLCFAEFGARVPKAGSAYVYTFVTIGEGVAFLVGWNLIIEYAIGSASVAKGLSNYIDSLADNAFSDFWLRTLPLNIPYMGRYIDLFTFAMVMAVSIGLALGAKESTMMNNIFATIKIAVIIFVIVCGSFKFDFSNWSIPADQVPEGFGNGGFFPYGFDGIVKGAAKCFYGFIGFDIIASAGEEVKNPKKSIPLSICLSLLIVFLAFIGVSSVLTLAVPYFKLDDEAALPMVFTSFGWTTAVWIVSIGSIFGLFSCLIATMFPLPRIVYAMAEDGLLFNVFARVHSKFKTPTWGILIAGFLTATISAIFDVNQLVNMISIGTLMAYTAVAVCVLILKYECDSGGNSCDERKDFWLKLLNVDNQKQATRFTSRLSKVMVLIYVALCAWFTSSITSMSQASSRNAATDSLLAIPSFIIIITLLILVRQPKSQKVLSFSVPFTPWFPAISILINIYLLVQLDVIAWIRFGVWMAIGLSIYAFYGRRYSKLKTPKHSNLCNISNNCNETNY